MREGCKQCLDWQTATHNHREMIKFSSIGGLVLLAPGFILFPPFYPGEVAWTRDGWLWSGAMCISATIFLCIFGYRALRRRRYFHFLDNTGESHCHRQKPVVVQLDSTDPKSKRYLWIDPQFEHPKGEETEHGVLNLDDFVVASHILEVHLGGIRRKHRVWQNSPGATGTLWNVVRRKGSEVELSCFGGGSVTNYPMTLLSIMRHLDGESFFVEKLAAALTHQETVQAGARALMRKLETSNGLLDWLGIGVTALHRELLETRAWSRSPVGKLARERLEALLGPCTVGQSDCWMQGKPTPEGETAYAAIVTARLGTPVATPLPRSAVPGEI